MNSKGKAETASRDKNVSGAVRIADRVRQNSGGGGTRAVSFVALVLLVVSLAGCGGKNSGANPDTQPKYPLHWLARDVSVGEGAFLEKAKEHHGDECRSLCTLETIKDQNFCVGLCNAIKAAGEQHRLLNVAIDAVCTGPGWREGTAPCRLDEDPAARAAREAELQKRLTEFQGAMDALKRAGGGQ